MIASLVYSPVSSGAVSVVANLGRIKLLGALTSACGPGVHRSSHLPRDTSTHMHRHAHTHKERAKAAFTRPSLHFERDRLASACSTEVAGSLPEGDSLNLLCSPSTPFHTPWLSSHVSISVKHLKLFHRLSMKMNVCE